MTSDERFVVVIVVAVSSFFAGVFVAFGALDHALRVAGERGDYALYCTERPDVAKFVARQLGDRPDGRSP